MRDEEKIGELKQLDLFKNLCDDELIEIEPYFSKRFYNRNEVVYTTSTLAKHFIFLIKGKIKVFRLSELGKEQIIRLIEPNEFTGELALFESKRKAYATALVQSVAYIIEHQHLREILTRNPGIALKMIEILTYRLQLSEEQTSWLSTNTAKERLWLYLNKAAQLENNKLIVHHAETKKFLASYLGMTSETLSRMLHQLEDEGSIRQHSEYHLEIFPHNGFE